MMRNSRLGLGFGVIVGLAMLAASAAVADRAGNRLYVQSGPGGVFYARCMPAAIEGREGVTEIYRVEQGGDVVVDRYAWYTPAGVTLGWSPIAGKVAVLAAMAEEKPDRWQEQEELRFEIGGKLLARYTTGDLVAMGGRPTMSSVRARGVDYRIIGCEQVPGTNEYDFVIELGKQTLRFDILTGQIRKPSTQPSP